MLRKIEKSIFLSKPIIGIVTRLENNMHKINKSLINPARIKDFIEIIPKLFFKRIHCTHLLHNSNLCLYFTTGFCFNPNFFPAKTKHGCCNFNE